MNAKSFKLSLILPVFNEEPVVEECVRRVTAVLQQIACDYELLFVNDGSTDRTLAKLLQLKEADPKIKIIDLSRNFGHQMAITAGLDLCDGDAVVVLDADMQDPPELIIEMVRRWREEGFDLVHARRTNRLGESLFKTFTAAMYYKIIKSMSGTELPTNVGDFRLISRRALDVFNKLRERHRYIRGLMSWIGFPQAYVEYERQARCAGKTKFSLLHMLRFSIDGILSFTAIPLRLSMYMGILGAITAIMYLPYTLYIKFIAKQAIIGWTSLVVLVLFVGSLQLICLGIIGEYLAIMYDEIKGRPLYIINSVF